MALNPVCTLESLEGFVGGGRGVAVSETQLDQNSGNGVWALVFLKSSSGGSNMQPALRTIDLTNRPILCLRESGAKKGVT